MKTVENVNDMYLESIKAKISILEDTFKESPKKGDLHRLDKRSRLHLKDSAISST
jgi:hypothetical protein